MLNFKQIDTPSLIKWAILAVLAAFSLYVVLPVKEKVRLGLDLQGGTSFTVEIDRAKLFEDLKAEGFAAKSLEPSTATAEQIADIEKAAQLATEQRMSSADTLTLEVLRKRIDAIGTNEPIIAAGQNHRILIQIPGADAEQSRLAEESVKSAAFLTFRLVHKDNARLSREVMDSVRTPDGFVRSLTTTGQTCFIRSADYPTLSKAPDFAVKLGRFATPSALYECVMEEAGIDKAGAHAYVPMYVSRSRDTTVGGDTVTKAGPSRNSTTGSITVNIQFNDEGRSKFAKVTSRYVGRNLAIILDGIVRSAPVLKSEITDGNCEISGSFTWKDASELSGVLNAGALKAPIRIVEKRSVSPSLGEEAIEKGMIAGALGIGLVLIFMLVYYSLCGVVADIALLLNMLLWPAGMIIASGLMSVFVSDGTGSSSMGQLPVLTLPGIAGLVLSIGMAVDANVLIFERVREEFRLGKTAKAAIAAGYDRAFLAIFDSNLTTLITGVILFIFGSGPIRGFAVTLCGGIIISMFTALVITRLIFNLITDNRTKPFHMMQLIPEGVNFDFCKWAKPAISLSALIIIATLGIFFFRAIQNPAAVMAVDFTGGVALTYEGVDKKSGEVITLDTEKVRAVVASTGVTDQTVQTSTAEGGKNQTLVKTSTVTLELDGQSIASATVIEGELDKAYPELTVRLVSEERVGSQIGGELKKDATWAAIISLICIVIYVGFRFELGFAIGGVVALVHDALITLGIFTIMGNQVSLTTVAALLTIIGYSINDTIVIFDRIREDMRNPANDKLSFPELCRHALNQTLSRTILTTVSTLLCVLALWLFGGAAMHAFAFALFIGMVAGTYSTLFIATPVMLMWYRNKRPRAVVEGGMGVEKMTSAR
ncbi:MAG: protein translocase subunit SecD [Kiritimatiellia bacterium]